MSPSLLKTPPLSLYIHVPWCIKKCPYCDFNSHKKNGELPEEEYIYALLEDLQKDKDYIQNRTLHSIFIGGGTPSLFSAASFARLLNEIEKVVPFAKDIEITLEANPGTFEQEKFSGYHRAGINRLSIGIQSFQKDKLQSLGRVHDDKEALRAADIARQAGFDNFNLDLMFGLPDQTQQQALEDLEIAISCQPTHISWYQLTIEPNTNFYSNPPVLPGDDSIYHMQQAGQAYLADHGFQFYEISAYSQLNKQAQHNLNYWQFGDYLGIGAGAHGKITLPEKNQIIRTRKTRQPGHYLDKNTDFTTETKAIAADDLGLEFMMNTMRLREGSDIATFEARTGLGIDSIKGPLSLLREKKLMENKSLIPTQKGQQYLNDLLGYFI